MVTEVVRDTERRQGSWDWTQTNPGNSSTLVLVSRCPYEVVDPSYPWKGGVWVAETSKGPSNYLRVQQVGFVTGIPQVQIS